MKVIQEQVEFKPVVIKLESQFEVDIMSDLTAWCYNHLSDAKNENQFRNYIGELSTKLADFSSDQGDYVYLCSNESEGDIKFK